MKKVSLNVLWILSLFMLVLGGCGDESREKVDPAPAKAIQGASGPVSYYSPEGHFHIVWPSGCSKIRLQTWHSEGIDDPDSLVRAKIFCDRENHEGEGCAVGIQFLSNLPGKPEATPERVIETIKAGMQSFNVEIVSQSPLTRVGFDGVGVKAVPVDGGEGTFWTEGFIINGDIYVLSAWSTSRSIFKEEDFVNFFAGFDPELEDEPTP